MVGRTAALVVVVVAVVAGWAYQAMLKPPPPKIPGTTGGPQITSPRIRLSDGRYLAYKETGVLPREKARHKIVLIHGFDSTKDFSLPASQSLVEELGVYFVSFDRAGYGDSDPNPNRTVKSEAMDIQELADQLDLGQKFYLIGASMGGYPAWSCLKHIPHRVAGASLIVPVVNFWWPSLPAGMAGEALGKVLSPDRYAFMVAHHAPSLLYAYMTQGLVIPSKLVNRHPDGFSRQDKEIWEQYFQSSAGPTTSPEVENKARQQGVFESLHRDLMVVFGDWGFEPMGLNNPFPDHNSEGSSSSSSVHIWQGYEDRIVPVEIQRYVAEKLPWIRYHECSECGHMFVFIESWSNRILKALLLGGGGEEKEEEEDHFPTFSSSS